MTEYIERKTPEGVCECGHLESLHDPSHIEEGVTVAGAGACVKCACGWFTWVRFAQDDEAW